MNVILRNNMKQRENIFDVAVSCFVFLADVSFNCQCVYAEGSLNVTGLGDAGHFPELSSLPHPPLESLGGALTEKSHKTSFKGQTEIACLSNTTSSSPALVHSYMRWRHGGGTGMSTFASWSLGSCKNASIWMDCQWLLRGAYLQCRAGIFLNFLTNSGSGYPATQGAVCPW